MDGESIRGMHQLLSSHTGTQEVILRYSMWWSGVQRAAYSCPTNNETTHVKAYTLVSLRNSEEQAESAWSALLSRHECWDRGGGEELQQACRIPKQVPQTAIKTYIDSSIWTSGIRLFFSLEAKTKLSLWTIFQSSLKWMSSKISCSCEFLWSFKQIMACSMRQRSSESSEKVTE